MSNAEHPPFSAPLGERKRVVEQAGASDDSIQQTHAVLLREKPEPAEGYSPIPILLLFILSGLIFWGGVYIGEYHADWNPLVYDHRFTAAAAGPVEAPKVDPMKVGAQVYAAQCVACHQANGQGLAGNFPPLAQSEWVIGENSEKLLPRVLLHGLNGPIKVLGIDYNGNMPAFGAALRDPQIAAVLTYIRNSWGNQGSEITAEQVAEARKKYGSRPPWKGDEIFSSLKD